MTSGRVFHTWHALRRRQLQGRCPQTIPRVRLHYDGGEVKSKNLKKASVKSFGREQLVRSVFEGGRVFINGVINNTFISIKKQFSITGRC